MKKINVDNGCKLESLHIIYSQFQVNSVQDDEDCLFSEDRKILLKKENYVIYNLTKIFEV